MTADNDEPDRRGRFRDRGRRIDWRGGVAMTAGISSGSIWRRRRGKRRAPNLIQERCHPQHDGRPILEGPLGNVQCWRISSPTVLVYLPLCLLRLSRHRRPIPHHGDQEIEIHGRRDGYVAREREQEHWQWKRFQP